MRPTTEILSSLIILLLLIGCLAAGFRLLRRAWSGEAVLPRRSGEPVSWPPLAGVLVFLFTYVAPALLLKSVWSVRASPSLEFVQWVCVLSVLQIGTAIAMLATVSTLRASDLGLQLVDWRVDVSTAVDWFLASLIPVFGINLLIEKLGWRAPDGQHDFLRVLKLEPGVATAVWVGVAVVVLAPLIEELLFRVVVQGSLEKVLVPWQAILITATLFAAAHHQEGRPDAIPLFPLALALGLVYQRTRSYLAVVLIHALFNGTNLALALLTT